MIFNVTNAWEHEKGTKTTQSPTLKRNYASFIINETIFNMYTMKRLEPNAALYTWIEMR